MLVAPHNRVGLATLTNREAIYDGGLLGRLISGVSISGSTSSGSPNLVLGVNLNVVAYISQLFFNSTRYSASGIGFNSSNNENLPFTVPGNRSDTVLVIIYLLLPLFCCLFPAIIWTILHKARHHHFTYLVADKVKMLFCLRFNKVMGMDRGVKFSTSAKQQSNQKKMLLIRIILCFCGWVMLVTFVFAFCFAFAAIVDVDYSLQDRPETNIHSTTKLEGASFSIAWTSATDFVDSFFQKLTQESYNIFSITIDNITSSLTSLLQSSIQNLTDLLMKNVSVPELFNASNSLINSLGITVDSMEFIRQNAKGIIRQIDIKKGKLEAMSDQLFDSIDYVCNITRGVNLTKCRVLQNDCKRLVVPISTANINTESSVNMQFLLLQLNLNITEVNLKVKNIEVEFTTQLSKLTQQKIDELKLGNSVNNVRAVWLYINRTVFPWKNDFSQLNIQVASTTSFIGASFVVVSTLLILVPTLCFVVVYSLVLYCVSYRFYLEYLISQSSATANLSRAPFMSVLDNYKSKQSLVKFRHKTNYRAGGFYIYFIVASILIFFIALISIICYTTGFLVYNEVCVQLNSNEGQLQMDSIINTFFQRYWKLLTSSLDISKSPVELIFSQPSNILLKIKSNCTGTNGLLYAAEINNIINISSFIWSPENMAVLRNGLNGTYNAIVDINIANIIPSNIQALFVTAKNVTEYFDKINYQDSINELYKPLMSLQDPVAWTTNAKLFFSNLPEKNQLLAGIVLSQLNKLHQFSLDLTQFGDAYIIPLRNHFLRIQENRQNNELINRLLEILRNMQSTLNRQSPYLYSLVKALYSQTMLYSFPREADLILNILMADMMRRIFPCSELVSAGSLFLGGVCGSSNATINNNTSLVISMAGCGLNCIVLALALMVMQHLVWALIRAMLRERDEDEDCTTC